VTERVGILSLPVATTMKELLRSDMEASMLTF